MSRIVTDPLIESILKSDAILFHDQYQDPYIALNGDGSKVVKINSKLFGNWVARECWQRYQASISSDDVSKIVQTLSGWAKFDGTEYKLHLRHAWDSGSLIYDMGEDRPPVLISAGSWLVMKTNPIIFRRLPHQRQQIWPDNAKIADIKQLKNFVNLVDDQDYLLFVTYLIAAFIPDFPHPLLFLSGPQGSGKSTPMRIIKTLVDPSVLQTLTAPNKIEEFVQQAHHHAFLFYDNLSKLPLWQSDALARASTGDGFSKRMLFTDDDDVVFILKLPIALNGINQLITKPDLLDRSILLKLTRIPSKDRKSEGQFWNDFNEKLPVILGAIFEILANAIKIYPSIKLDEMPRMADFMKWGCAITEAMGIKQQNFIDAYNANIDRQNDEAIEASPVAQAVLILMEDIDKWEGTATELLQVLNNKVLSTDLSKSPIWPKDSVWLTRRINDVEVNLLTKSIYVDHRITTSGRLTILTKDTDNSVNTDNHEDSITVVTEDPGVQKVIDIFELNPKNAGKSKSE